MGEGTDFSCINTSLRFAGEGKVRAAGGIVRARVCAENSAKAENTARTIRESATNTGVRLRSRGCTTFRHRRLDMTFKIERTHSGQVTTIRLVGRLGSECLQELKRQIESGGPQLMLDLAEVELVDVEVVRFLNACQNEGAVIANGSPYIREWMLRERKPGA